MKMTISPLPAFFTEERPLEIVERKGLGHPDSLSDALAEELSLSLSRFYLDRFGLILHHNVDKALLWGGQARPAFGGGEVVKPIELYLSGRATYEHASIAVPVAELAIEGSRDWLRRHLKALDSTQHIVIHPLIRPGSADLVELYLRAAESGRWLANDTSCGVGYAPLSRLEGTVLALEQWLNAPARRSEYPHLGEDVKVMGIRRDARIELTIACAFIGRYVSDLDDYVRKKAALTEALAREAARLAGSDEISVVVNTADDIAAGSVYLTVTGTSAEAGDDGQAGRGNRANGLITPYRPMTMESLAGKNPVTHVGKLYNILAGLIAQSIVETMPEIGAAEVYLVSRIGHPVSEPTACDIRVALRDDGDIDALRPAIEEVLRGHLARAGTLWREMLSGVVAFDRWPLRQTTMP